MSTCPNCGDSFKPANSDHLPFCGERCQNDYAMGFDAAEQRINELEGQNAELSARVAELTAEIAELRGGKTPGEAALKSPSKVPKQSFLSKWERVIKRTP